MHIAESFSTSDQIMHFMVALLEKGKTLCTPSNSVASAAQKIKDYLDLHFAEDISLSDLSEIVHLNSKYVSDLFRKEYEITLTNYVTQKRMEKAKLLLLRSKDPIVEISEQVGYNDAKYFTRLFKRNNGISPAQFRKLYK